MNFFKYQQNGQSKLGYFYSDWKEVPFKSFIEWQRLAAILSEMSSELKAILADLTEKKAKIADYERDGQTKLVQKTNAQIIQQAEKIKGLKDKIQPLELQAISLFTDCPLAVIMQLKGFESDKLGFNPELSWADAPQDSIQFFKSLFWALSRQPLPTDKPISSIKWQTKTDAEIAELQKRYDSLNWYSRTFSKIGKELREELNKAIWGEWKIRDIWEHTTYANMQFQKQAKVIINEMERGVWDNLDTLVCMLMVESSVNIENELIGEKDGAKYIEKYALRYKEIFDRNKQLFFEQKQTLTVGHLLGIRGFFLHKRER